MPINAPELLPSREAENQTIQGYIENQILLKDQISILEAGCGRQWPFELDKNTTQITGIDSDVDAMKHRSEVVNDLDNVIIGDLTTHTFPDNQFDVIYSAYVLEHIEQAESVLEKFQSWLTSDGIIIILVPDPNSAHGFITRVTPHWFHVFYYKYILKRANAGEPGHNPYPTYYSDVISREGIRRFCSENGCELVAEYAEGYWQPGNGMVRLAIKCTKSVISLLSLSRLSSKHSNLIYVVSKSKS